MFFEKLEDNVFEVESEVWHGRALGHPPSMVPPLKVAAISLSLSLFVFFLYFCFIFCILCLFDLGIGFLLVVGV